MASRAWIVACLGLLVVACGATEQSSPARTAAFSSEVVALFPSATEVKLYAYPDGASALAFGVDPTPASQPGATLSAAEQATVQQLIRTAPAADPAACACIFRHIFAFFDASGRKLGELAICLDCQCAARLTAPEYAVELLVDGYTWDDNAVRQILAAHQVPTFDRTTDG